MKHNDSYGGRLKSSILVTSIEQTVEGKKIFRNIEVPAAVKDTQTTNKKYVGDQISGLRTEHTDFVQKSGDTMTGALIVPKESYPIRGDLNKVINYSTQRDIFICALKRDAQVVFCKGFYFFGISHSPRTPLGHAYR